MVHTYPTLEKVAEIRDAHSARVLGSAISPLGDVVVTNGGDENIKFWRIWDAPPKKPKRKPAAQVVESGFRSIR